jgi:hypothetical protein
MALSRITEAVASFTDLTIGDDLTLTDDLLMASDANIIKFGADADVTLTHVHNTGLLLNSTSVIQFNDSSQNIGAPNATTLDINADAEIELNTTLVDVNANLDVDGTIVASGTITGGTFSGGNVVIPDAGNIGSASDTNAIGISSGGVVSITATTANTSASNGALTVAGGVGIAADLSVGDDLRLISDAAVLNFGADNDVTLTHVADTGLLLNSSRKLQFSGANDSIHSDGSKLILTSNGVAFSLPTADGSSGQTLVTNGSGVLSFAAASSNTPSSADGQALGSASLEWSDLFLADGGQILFGNDQEITLTHDADVGLKLKHTATADDKPIVLTLQTGETDMAANDVMGAIRFQAPDEGTGTDAILVAAAIQAVSEGDFSASSNATRLEFHTGASEAASSKMTLSSAGLLTIADDLMIKDGGTIGVASTNDAITISSAGIVTFKDDILIKDGGTIGSASDADAITIAANGQLTLTQTLIGTALDISGDMDIDGTSNMDVIDVDGTANFAGDVTIATGADLITATAGASNVRIGVNAGDSITSGTNYNVVVGDEAGTNLDGGDSNTLIGYKAGNAVTAGGSNTAVGYEALMTEDANGTNVAVGTGALRTQNAGADANNVAIGHTAGYNLTTGKLHTLVGAGAGLALTTGGSAAAVGYQSLYNSQDGGGNNAFGYRAGYNITSGNRNIAIGEQGMYGLTTANDCIGMGQQSFYATCTGSSNIGMGYRSFFSATSGHSNVGIGHQTLEDLSSADESVAIGYRALPHVSVSDSNIGIGAKTGDGIRGTGLTNGTANILIGREADTNAADTDYSIVMGVHAVAKGSSTGFISPNDGAVYQGNNSSSWSTTSDRRIKKNIVDNTVGLDAINKVQVKNFEYRTEDEITEVPSHARINKEGVQLGVIAQEIQTILPDMVNEESTGVLSVNPDNMTWYLVNAVQELSAKNDALEARIKELEGN